MKTRGFKIWMRSKGYKETTISQYSKYMEKIEMKPTCSDTPMVANLQTMICAMNKYIEFLEDKV